MHAISQQDAVSTENIHTVVCEDGYQLHYRLWAAPGATAGTMILVNGMMGHSGWCRELANLLTHLQLDVVGADRRGSGLNERGRGDLPSREMLLSDLRRVIENEDRAAPLYLLGSCWGALPAINLALELGQKLSGLVLLAPGLFPSPRITRAIREQMIAAHSAATDSPVLRSPLTAEMFSDRVDIREFVCNDRFAQRQFTPRFFRVTREMSLIATVGLSQLKQRLLLLLAASDETSDNEKTLKAFQPLPSIVATAILPCHHGMQFEMPKAIVMHISLWLQNMHSVDD
jgi:pimeloyl-ACP methyl ester carboxylesterase